MGKMVSNYGGGIYVQRNLSNQSGQDKNQLNEESQDVSFTGRVRVVFFRVDGLYKSTRKHLTGMHHIVYDHKT